MRVSSLAWTPAGVVETSRALHGGVSAVPSQITAIPRVESRSTQKVW